jgi:hypothetical protein
MPKVKKEQFIAKALSEYGDFEEIDGDVKCTFCGIKVCYY